EPGVAFASLVFVGLWGVGFCWVCVVGGLYGTWWRTPHAAAAESVTVNHAALAAGINVVHTYMDSLAFFLCNDRLTTSEREQSSGRRRAGC
ncbi:MAG: hypothetical protein ABWZ16_13610, partial [Microbacterium sp.]